jgi:carbamoyl-phosphate synthase large subunit
VGTPVNILFTSVGRRVELLRSFRRAYEELGLDGKIVAIDVDRLASGLQAADVACLVPRLDSPEYIPELTRVLRKEEIAIVFPLIDPDVPLLAAHRQQLEQNGTRLAVVPVEAAKIAADKWETQAFFGKLGLPVPRSWLPGHREPDATEYPLFIKPRFGSASQHAFAARNENELAFFTDYISRPIIQEYLAGPEITNDVICDWDGRLVSVISRQRIRARGGEVLIGKTVFDPEIADACVRIAQALPAIGPITVQCMMHHGQPVYTEINARLGGGAPAAVAAGADFPRWLLARAAGLSVDIPPLGEYSRNVYFSRFDESFMLSESNLQCPGKPSSSISTIPYIPSSSMSKAG